MKRSFPMKMHKELLVFALPLLLAAGPADPAPTGDLAKLQGRWTTSAGPKRDIPVTIEIEGSTVKVDVTSPLGVKVHAEGKLKINESAKPKAIDWIGFTSADGQDL